MTPPSITTQQVCDELTSQREVLFVDNGSADGSAERLAVAAGHLILAAATAVGCIEGVGRANWRPNGR